MADTFDDTLKVRCHSTLIKRLEEIAKAERRSFSDFLRLVLEDYADAQEATMQLREGPDAKPSATPHKGPVKYGKAKSFSKPLKKLAG